MKFYEIISEKANMDDSSVKVENIWLHNVLNYFIKGLFYFERQKKGYFCKFLLNILLKILIYNNNNILEK